MEKIIKIRFFFCAIAPLIFSPSYCKITNLFTKILPILFLTFLYSFSVLNKKIHPLPLEAERFYQAEIKSVDLPTQILQIENFLMLHETVELGFEFCGVFHHKNNFVFCLAFLIMPNSTVSCSIKKFSICRICVGKSTDFISAW